MKTQVSKLLKKAKKVAEKTAKKVQAVAKMFTAESAKAKARPVLNRAIQAAERFADPIVEASIGRKAKVQRWGEAWYALTTMFVLSTLKDKQGHARFNLKSLGVKGPKPKSAETEQPIAASGLTVIKYSLGLFGSKDATIKAREDAVARTVWVIIRRGAESWAKSNGYLDPKKIAGHYGETAKGRKPGPKVARIAYALGNRYAPFNFENPDHVGAMVGLFDPERVKGFPVGDIRSALIGVQKRLATEALKKAEAEKEKQEQAKDVKAKVA